ncbi:hypothetical protein SLEP1_g4216 [Rubroshorea leprosula]|uniref:Uncharacterized protein n=1 Tax=Rubroshorea leprosula TaxID=152421 RepID=A0AAV5HXN0_9ROSI|nr:hypothetical protein SLEP1_g4216 [Rubroshorea leprosula]
MPPAAASVSATDGNKMLPWEDDALGRCVKVKNFGYSTCLKGSFRKGLCHLQDLPRTMTLLALTINAIS